MSLNHYSVSDVINSVTRQFGDESGVQITEDDIIRWINTACMEMNSKNKILRASDAKIRDPQYGTVPVPDDVMIINDVFWLDSTLTYHLLTKIDLKDFYHRADKASQLSSNEPPKFWNWTQGEERINLLPKGPDDQLTYSFTYVPEPPILSTPGDTLPLPDRYYDRIVEFVLSKAYELDENWQARQAMLADFDKNMDLLNHAETDTIGDYQVIRDVDVM